MAEKFKIPHGVKTPGPVDVGPFNRFGKYATIGGIMYGRYKSQSELTPCKVVKFLS